MSPTKREDIRSARRWFKPEQAPAIRRGREHWTVRWIGAAKRRALKPVAVEARPVAQVIRLNWADTFGRPVRLLQFAGTFVPLLPL